MLNPLLKIFGQHQRNTQLRKISENFRNGPESPNLPDETARIDRCESGPGTVLTSRKSSPPADLGRGSSTVESQGQNVKGAKCSPAVVGSRNCASSYDPPKINM